MQLKTNVLYSRQMLDERIGALAEQIEASYPKVVKKIICLCLLRRAVLKWQYTL